MARATLYMQNKDIEKVIEGIIDNADIVAKTYGYSGHDICIRFNGRNLITNDGVFVSNHIFFDNETKDIGSALVRGITLNSDLSSGDGTTAAAILAKAIMLKLKPYLLDKKYQKKIHSMLDVKKGMKKAVEEIDLHLLANKKRIDEKDENSLYQIAFTATRDEELSRLLSTACIKIGKDGRVLYKEHEGNNIEVEYKEGFNLDYGYDTVMLPNIFTEPLILIYDERINSTEIMKEIIGAVIKNSSKNLVLFVKDGVADLVMQQLIQIQQSPQIDLNINVIKLIGNDTKIKRELIDLSIITGATIINNSSISALYSSNVFGTAKNININDKQTTIVGGKIDKDKFNTHINNLQTAYENNRNEDDKESIKKRIANLQGQVAIIKIGGLSRERIENYKDKIKDAVGSVKNAIDKGVVYGGGVALLSAYKKIITYNEQSYKPVNKDEMIGYNIVLNALKSPINQILENSYEKSKKVNKQIFDLKKYNIGYNAMTNKVTENLFNDGIIDPYLTIINSLRNAVDLCSLFTNLEGFIVVKSEVMNNE